MEQKIYPDQSTPERAKVVNESKVLRPLRRGLGIATLAVAALGPGKAEAMDQNTKNTLFGFGAIVLNKETGVVLRPGANGPVIDPGATMQNRQIMEQRRRQEEQVRMQQEQVRMQQAQQQERQRMFDEAMRSPTNIHFDNDANMAFKQQGLDISQTDLRVFHPSNYEGGFFLTPNQTKKYTSVDVSQPATNVFLISASYVFKSGNQIGQIGRDVSRYRYHPNEKVFKEILLKQ